MFHTQKIVSSTEDFMDLLEPQTDFVAEYGAYIVATRIYSMDNPNSRNVREIAFDWFDHDANWYLLRLIDPKTGRRLRYYRLKKGVFNGTVRPEKPQWRKGI